MLQETATAPATESEGVDHGASATVAADPVTSPSGGMNLSKPKEFLRQYWKPLAFAVTSAVVVLVVFRPFEKLGAAAPLEPAEIWSERIAQYGLSPIFPLQEDFHVGDVWLTVEPEAVTVPFRKHSVRVDHIDARAAIRQSASRAIVFQPTVFASSVDEAETSGGTPAPRVAARDQPDLEAEPAGNDKIRMSDIAFPDVTFKRNTTSRGSVGLDQMSVEAQRRGGVTESISIPGSQTYGFEAPFGVPMMIDWCNVPENNHFCTDSGARAFMAIAVDPSVLDRHDGKLLPISLQLVTRVFLTRQIIYAHEDSGSRTANLLSGENSEGRGQGSGDETATGPASTTDLDTGRGGGMGESAAGQLTYSNVFDKPMAFGYRAISLKLVPKEE